jgi:hypothetical protein
MTWRASAFANKELPPRATDALGEATWTELAPGLYDVEIAADGKRYTTQREVEVEDEDTAVPFDLDLLRTP